MSSQVTVAEELIILTHHQLSITLINSPQLSSTLHNFTLSLVTQGSYSAIQQSNHITDFGGSSNQNLQQSPLMAKGIKKTNSQTKTAKSKDIAKNKLDHSTHTPTTKSKRCKTLPEKTQPQPTAISQKEDYTLQLEAGVYTLKMNQTYTVPSDHVLFKQIESLFELFKKKEEKINKKIHVNVPHSYFPSFLFELRGEKASENKCSICQFEYEEPTSYQDQLAKESEDDIIALSCSHLLHKSCFTSLKGDKDWVRCPVCFTIFGQMIGDQPPGNMNWVVNKLLHCSGYETVGTIVINYSMFSGKRGSISFPGTHRTAYLPDNKEGNKVLQLLQKAFERKLIFTIGRSVTTGRDNQVVWNGIHHKTKTQGGSAYFGYPDATYFDRVKLQLAAKGVV